MKSRISSVLMAASALLLLVASCKEPEPEVVLNPSLSVDPEEYAFDPEGEMITINVKAVDTKWTAPTTVDWIKASFSDDAIMLTAAPNDTDAAREALFHVIATADQNLIASIRLTQEAMITELSEVGSANCYIITEPGSYCFDATVMGNGKTVDGLDAPKTLAPASAALVWQTSTDFIKNVKLNGDKISFRASEVKGNAVVAAKDKDGAIIWSWHIWAPEAEVSALASVSGASLMNMNLGAMNNEYNDPKAYGMLYQWGRKDPFPSSPTLTGDTSTLPAVVYNADGSEVAFGHSSWTDASKNTIDYAIAHPTECLSNYAQYATSRDWLKASDSNDALWGNPKGETKEETIFVEKGSKTYYDPCPAGWRVPYIQVFQNFSSTGAYGWTYDMFDIADVNGDGKTDADDYVYGFTFNLSSSVSSFFPAAARFDGSYGMLYGSKAGIWSSYWTNSPYKGSGLACALACDKATPSVSPYAGGSRADAYSVRCIKE